MLFFLLLPSSHLGLHVFTYPDHHASPFVLTCCNSTTSPAIAPRALSVPRIGLVSSRKHRYRASSHQILKPSTAICLSWLSRVFSLPILQPYHKHLIPVPPLDTKPPITSSPSTLNKDAKQYLYKSAAASSHPHPHPFSLFSSFSPLLPFLFFLSPSPFSLLSLPFSLPPKKEPRQASPSNRKMIHRIPILYSHRIPILYSHGRNPRRQCLADLQW